MKEKHTKVFATNIEDTALQQFNSAMAQDFTIAGALMPDAHTGYSLPIGAVVATRDIVVPAWVGYDIGCGVCAQKIPYVYRDAIEEKSEQIFDRIYERIPVGFNTNKISQTYSIDKLTSKGQLIAKEKKYDKAICSLGGGNHFIEIGYDDSDAIWVIIHSGSRGVGHGIASHYMTKASNNPEMFGKDFDETHKQLREFNPDAYESHKKEYIDKRLKKAKPLEGHFGFYTKTKEGLEYIQDMNWCIQYALDNRRLMMKRIYDIFVDLGAPRNGLDQVNMINRTHNHAIAEHGMWIHRKGATHAEQGMLGVIPGNMRDGSFIVRGKGNANSLWSSSHGAGRVMSRKKAKELINLSDFENDMEGITARVTNDTIDESPAAYKNIHDVMRLQQDMVSVIRHIKPILNVKG